MKEYKEYYVYITTNKNDNVLYIGITNDLIKRIYEHKTKLTKGFTAKYNVDKLIYFENFNAPDEAINREKQLKNWHREWKINLINEFNSE